MKPSHLRTPRNMSDTQFTTGYYSAIHSRPRLNWWWVAAGVLSLLTWAALIWPVVA